MSAAAPISRVAQGTAALAMPALLILGRMLLLLLLGEPAVPRLLLLTLSRSSAERQVLSLLLLLLLLFARSRRRVRPASCEGRRPPPYGKQRRTGAAVNGNALAPCPALPLLTTHAVDQDGNTGVQTPQHDVRPVIAYCRRSTRALITQSCTRVA